MTAIIQAIARLVETFKSSKRHTTEMTGLLPNRRVSDRPVVKQTTGNNVVWNRRKL